MSCIFTAQSENTAHNSARRVLGANDFLELTAAHIVDRSSDRNILRDERRLANGRNIIAHALLQIREWQKVAPFHISANILLNLFRVEHNALSTVWEKGEISTNSVFALTLTNQATAPAASAPPAQAEPQAAGLGQAHEYPAPPSYRAGYNRLVQAAC